MTILKRWATYALLGAAACVLLLVYFFRAEPSSVAATQHFLRLTDLEPECHPAKEVEVRAASLGRHLRRSFVATPGTELRFVIEDFANPLFRASLGVTAGSEPETKTSIELAVLAAAGEDSADVLVRETLPVLGGKKDRWHETELDLSSYVRQDVELVLKATGPADAGVVYWGNPVLLADPSQSREPNVIFVSIDTIAAQHLSVYGYDRPTSPRLEEFATDSVVFEQSIAHQSWTLTSHMSMFTSLYPDTHRVSLGTPLAEHLPLLPEELHSRGYYTMGYINNPYLEPKYGYARGYDWYDFNHVRKDGEGRKIKRTMEENEEHVFLLLAENPPTPFFLFYHAIDPHSDWQDIPYDAPESFREQFVSPDREPVVMEDEGRKATWLLAAVNNGTATLDPEQVDCLRDLYDASLAYTDHYLGKLFDHLQEIGLYDSSLIVLTSDHGEEFLQHGATMHTQGYDECLRVPLMIKFPGNRMAGMRVDQQVQLVDLFPTILETLDHPVPMTVEGHSLWPVLRGEDHPQPFAIAKENNYSMTPKDSYVVRSEDWKLIWSPDSGATELYHLTVDPLEQTNVAAEHPSVHDHLLDMLREHRRQRDHGLRLRISAFEAEGVLTGRLITDGSFENVQEIDLNPGAMDQPFLERNAAGTELRFEIDPSGRYKFRRPLGVDFWMSDEATFLALEALFNGEPVSTEQVMLGPGLVAPDTMPVRLPRDTMLLRLGEENTLELTYLSSEPLFYLWESGQGGLAGSVALSAEDRELLQAMGYVDAD